MSRKFEDRLLFGAIGWLSTAVAGVVTALVLGRAGVTTPTATSTELPLQPNALERLVNEQRQEHVLPSLKSNAALRESACAKAGHMNTEDYFEHVAPDGTQPWSFFEEAGYRYTRAGENLARNFTDDAERVQAWIDSPSHRDNVLGEYEEQGICTVGEYTVEHLGVAL